MPQSAVSRKRKKPRTFSLSQDVVEVLESYKRQRKIASLTSALEELVREWKKNHLTAQVTSYYDELSDEDVEREKGWGSFSESQM
jgi:predicted CopG family antitoxin